MIKVGYYSLIGLVLLLLVSWTPHPISKMDADKACMDVIKNSFHKLYDTKVQKGKTYYVKYDVISVLKPTSQNAVKDKPEQTAMHVEILSTTDQLRFISDRITVYMDKKEVFTIIPSAKTIYRTDNPYKVVGNVDQQSQYKKLQDSLLAISKILSCESVSAYGADKKIVIVPQGKKAKYYDIEQITYYINSTDESVKKVKMEYVAARDLDYVEMTFQEVSYDYKKVTLDQPISSLVYHKTKLIGAYAGYKVMDKRITKH